MLRKQAEEHPDINKKKSRHVYIHIQDSALGEGNTKFEVQKKIDAG